MAFVFKSKKNIGDHTKPSSAPGPGTYGAHSEYKIPHSFAPFNSTANRNNNTDLTKNEDEPGPGAYNVIKDLSIGGKNPQFQVASIFADPKDLEEPKITSAFKSKVERFIQPQVKEPVPGPGTYYKPQTLIKKSVSVANLQLNIPPPASQEQGDNKLSLNTRMKSALAIPSIPSNVHGYGYTENEKQELILNKNPLLEVQQYVGPGYYNHKDLFEANKNKGSTWHKSGVKRFDNSQKKDSQPIGPGQYEVTKKNVPLYKLKPSAGFSSTTKRTFDIQDKKYNNKIQKILNSTGNLNTGGGIIGGFEDENGDLEEYIEDATPGPGYYHSEDVASSIKVSYKPYAHQFFGSGTQRFPEWEKPKTNLGPGEYNVNADIGKKINPNGSKIPFSSSNARFQKSQTIALQPGPGEYDPRANLRDKVLDKIRLGYRGNFGTTDRRFKAYSQTEETPGPGTYIKPEAKIGNNKGALHVFSSNTRRDPLGSNKNEDWPAPGTYEVNNFTIAKTVAKEEEDGSELKPMKPHFNSTEKRFPEPKITEVDEEDTPIMNKNTEGLREKKKPKSSSVFVSNSKRGLPFKKEPIPGPGTYNDPVQAQWNKRTYNILFAEVQAFSLGEKPNETTWAVLLYGLLGFYMAYWGYICKLLRAIMQLIGLVYLMLSLYLSMHEDKEEEAVEEGI